MYNIIDIYVHSRIELLWKRNEPNSNVPSCTMKFFYANARTYARTHAYAYAYFENKKISIGILWQNNSTTYNRPRSIKKNIIYSSLGGLTIKRRWWDTFIKRMKFKWKLKKGIRFYRILFYNESKQVHARVC